MTQHDLLDETGEQHAVEVVLGTNLFHGLACGGAPRVLIGLRQIANQQRPITHNRPIRGQLHNTTMPIGLSSVLCPRQHSIGYMGDGFYRSKDPTNSTKVLKEHTDKSNIQ